MIKKNVWVFLIFILWLTVTIGRLFSMGSTPFFLNLLAKREDVFSRQYLLLLKSGDIRPAEGYLAPDLSPAEQKNLPILSGDLSRMGDLVSMRLMNFSFFNRDKTPVRQLSYYADFEKKSALLQITLLKNGDRFWVRSFQYHLLPQSYEKTNHFSLAGKSWFHYLFLLTAVLFVTFTFFVLARCINSGVRRKWLWIPFIVLGLGRINLFWNDLSWQEAFQVRWMGSQPFSGGVLKSSIFAPWTLCLSLPLGALLFYFRHVKTKAKEKP
jgi:hypothetical protein